MKQCSNLSIGYLIIAFFTLLTFIISPVNVFADSSDYVLPYPSEMPGSKFYELHKLYENLEKYWYFGNFANYHYNLKYSDKYLVESKTLFEYKQYLLAYKALGKSDSYFLKTKNSLKNAKIKHIDTKEKEQNLKNASLKHIEVLNQLLLLTPSQFNWKPEKGNSTKIMIKEKINDSIEIRAL